MVVMVVMVVVVVVVAMVVVVTVAVVVAVARVRGMVGVASRHVRSGSRPPYYRYIRVKYQVRSRIRCNILRSKDLL